MANLQHIASNTPKWSLDELVETVNRLLPQFLPSPKSHGRVKENVTPRLVRHYTSAGLLDEPQKKGGRYAVYGYRHLLQLLVVRRLLAEGYGTNAIGDLAIATENTELEALLQGGVQLTVTPANPALGFLQGIKQRRNSTALNSKPAPADRPYPASMSVSPSETRWRHIEVLPGLEIHIREDFNHPKTTQERQNLLQNIAQKLFNGRGKKHENHSS
ncbi:MAG: MerR family transcriptional regulator [Spirulina sp.]